MDKADKASVILGASVMAAAVAAFGLALSQPKEAPAQTTTPVSYIGPNGKDVIVLPNGIPVIVNPTVPRL